MGPCHCAAAVEPRLRADEISLNLLQFRRLWRISSEKTPIGSAIVARESVGICPRCRLQDHLKNRCCHTFRAAIRQLKEQNKMQGSARFDMAKRTLNFPDRKISETFLDFAAPAMGDLPSEEPEHKAREALKVCFTVWNAVVFADVLKNNQFLEGIRALTAGNAGTACLMEQLIARKRTLFADDERLIGNWVVTRTAYGINLHAEACDPYSTPLGKVTSCI